MARTGALATPGADGRDVGAQTVFVRLVRLGRQPNQRVQRHLHPGALFLGHVHEVGVDAAQDGLVRHDEDVVAALELHDDGLEPDDDVAVRLAAQVPVVVLVVVALPKVGWILRLDLGVRQAVAHARVELVKRFPLELLQGQEARRLNGALERRRPDGQLGHVGLAAHRLAHQARQRARVRLAAVGKICVAADLAREIVLGLAMLRAVSRANNRERGSARKRETCTRQPDGPRLDV